MIRRGGSCHKCRKMSAGFSPCKIIPRTRALCGPFSAASLAPVIASSDNVQDFWRTTLSVARWQACQLVNEPINDCAFILDFDAQPCGLQLERFGKARCKPANTYVVFLGRNDC